MKRSNKAGKEEKRQEEKHSTPGLIRKLKLSGELRSKLEMAHSKKNSKQKQVREEGSTEEDSSQGSVIKLSEHENCCLKNNSMDEDGRVLKRLKLSHGLEVKMRMRRIVFSASNTRSAT
ncbi:uncharacterized protein LOC136042818 [Artemia franciscana]|uniref:uncharacterized protein LOC136042818 n=1 Tax=Artemia franciscana TaxID=6661 RepID=UPI0032DB37B8